MVINYKRFEDDKENKSRCEFIGFIRPPSLVAFLCVQVTIVSPKHVNELSIKTAKNLSLTGLSIPQVCEVDFSRKT